MKLLKKGDPCPCSGQPIKTSDGDVLLILSWVADKRRLPTLQEIRELYLMTHPEAADDDQIFPD